MVFGVVKRLLLGRPMRSDRLGHTLLPKRIALPVFASDALSSVAYATEEILIVLSVGGLAFFHYTPWIALAVGVLMLVVVASYRQNVHAYPSGGGDYEVASTNLGPKVGMTVASALMVDYTLTVAVSVSAGVANLASAFPVLDSHVTLIAVLVVAVIAVMNLRGVRESGTAFAIPTYCFIGVVALLIIWGFTRAGLGHHLESESAHYEVKTAREYTGVALIFLLLRAFSSGCTALTGVEAISNGVPAFRKPKSKNAATTLALLGAIAVSMFAGVTALALISHVHYAPPQDLTGMPAGTTQRTVIAQVGRAVFGDSSPLFYVLQFVTALILVLAANTAFNGFPVLASILARDGYLPRQLHTRGDRLAFSNGILLLSGFAILLIVVFQASPTRLIQLYIIGVFVSFVCSQTGMIRHWNRLLRTTTDRAVRRHMIRSRTINTIGACFTARRPGHRADQQVRQRRLDRGGGHAGHLADHARHPPALRARRGRADPAGRAQAHDARPQPVDRAGVQAAPADAAGAGLRQGHPPQLSGSGDGGRGRGGDAAAQGGLGTGWHPDPADRGRLAVPGDHPADRVLREAAAPGKPARHRDRLHPRVRARPLVGAAAAQPERAAAQDPAADAARRGRRQRAVPAAVRHPAAPGPAWGERPGGHRRAGRGRPGPGPARRPAPEAAQAVHRLTAGTEELHAADLQAECREVGATPIAETIEHEFVDVAGTLRTVTLRPRGASLTMEADLWDGTGSVTLVWLGRRDIPGIRPGRRIEVHGRLARIKDERTIYNPSYELPARPAPEITGLRSAVGTNR